MQKYPNVLFLRHDTYESIDAIIIKNRGAIDCDICIINSQEDLQNMFDPNINILVTYSPDRAEYLAEVTAVLPPRMFNRWLHFEKITDIAEFSRSINHGYIDSIIRNREEGRPTFSAFTTCYNSYEKIKRPLTSLLEQSMADWEWVILDDSPDDRHFNYLRDLFNGNKRVRLYRRSENSGNIGNVKNEAASLCRGKYILELDHDDNIVDTLFHTSKTAFELNPEVGFIYTDCISIYENGENYHFGDFIALGYGGYYCAKFQNRWVNVYVTPQVNNITLSHLVSLPNHARIWRREILFKVGNYCEFLPINDDQEILMRTCMMTTMMKIPEIGYIQYMNGGGNNFSLIRNSEINRIGPLFLQPQFYEMYKVQDFMREKGAHDDEKYMFCRERIWLRESYVPQYCNKLYQVNYDTQYCIIGTDIFLTRLEEIRELYKNPRNDFFLIDSSGDTLGLCLFINLYGFERMKCYTIRDLTVKQMIGYFNYIYKTAATGVIFQPDTI